MAGLNDIDIKVADVKLAYLQAPCREKVWTIANEAFFDEEGTFFKIVRALYGLSSSGAAFGSFMANMLDELNFKPSIADPDVWLRCGIRPGSTERYYEHVLVYVDDIMVLSAMASLVMEALQKKLTFKNGEASDPDIYLGAKIAKKKHEEGECWSMSSSHYLKAAIETVEEKLAKEGKKLPSNCRTPCSSSFCPELDRSMELGEDGAHYFRELIGMLRWATELGRVDILTEVSVLSQHQAAPRQGHLEEVLHIFGYLKKVGKLTLHFNPRMPYWPDTTNQTKCNSEDFLEHYRDAEEVLPPDAPVPLGKPVDLTAYVDASHAANKVTRRSHIGYILFVQSCCDNESVHPKHSARRSDCGPTVIIVVTAKVTH